VFCLDDLGAAASLLDDCWRSCSFQWCARAHISTADLVAWPSFYRQRVRFCHGTTDQMGWVDLPPSVGGHQGSVVVQGELENGEMAVMTSTLRGVLQLVQQHGAGSGVGAELAAKLARLSAQPPHAPQVAAAGAAPTPARVYAPPAAVQAPPAPAAARAVPQMPAAAAAPPPAPVAMAAAQPPKAAPPQAQPPAATAPVWSQCYSSDPSDHGNNAVAALTYVPRLSGLPGGDGHLGWLISSSRNIVNLFECNAGGGAKGIPSLMVSLWRG